MVFILELGMRFFTCPSRMRFAMNAFNVFDILAVLIILPTLPLSIAEVRTDHYRYYLVFLPVVLMLKLLRRFKTFLLLVSAFNVAVEALPVLLYTLILIVASFSALLFVVEFGERGVTGWQDSLWLTIATISTVGYGDIVTKTPGGKMVISALIVTGTLYMAIPIGIVGTAFSKVWEDRERLMVLQQMRDHVTAAGYTRTDIANMFKSLDQDGDCSLSFKEFKQVLPLMSIEMSDEALNQVFDTFDEDGEGTIDFQEFLVGVYPTTVFFSRKSLHRKMKQMTMSV